MSEATIFALASAPGRAGIAVVRISGAGAGGALRSLAGGIPEARRATRAKFHDSAGALIDDGLVLWFPAPASFTGEDVAELHIHGGRAVLGHLSETLAAIRGLRPAEPGEFTRRAFEHGKFDLTQAEALADLIDAETRAQQRQALRQMGGALKELYDDWRHRLVQALAHLEAVIDFPDEDLPQNVTARLWGEVADLRRDIAAHLDDKHRGERTREGLTVAIIGPPNAGKSSLLNTLVRRDAAIVSDIPGTTRDVIEVHLDLGGYAVTIADTAGLREAGDVIEDEGIRRAHRRAKEADLKIALFDGARYPLRDAATEAHRDMRTLAVVNKADLLSPPSPFDARDQLHFISVKSGFGLAEFLAALEARVREESDAGTGAPLTRARHRVALEETREALDRAEAAPLPELAAEDLRLAARALGRLTGRVDVDEILDVVFRDFCIGK
ncbi:MAG: tRNA uridine-5-carboxymethylaminomethyl(34) synthesis GTPase MnmE [Rhodospirillaceae bacterium]